MRKHSLSIDRLCFLNFLEIVKSRKKTPKPKFGSLESRLNPNFS